MRLYRKSPLEGNMEEMHMNLRWVQGTRAALGSTVGNMLSRANSRKSVGDWGTGPRFIRECA